MHIDANYADLESLRGLISPLLSRDEHALIGESFTGLGSWWGNLEYLADVSLEAESVLSAV